MCPAKYVLGLDSESMAVYRSSHALAEGFASALQNCQEVAILGSTVAFALRPAIVSPMTCSGNYAGIRDQA